MNYTASTTLGRLLYRAAIASRRLTPKARSYSFGCSHDDAIQRIYVINLDRQDARWRQVQQELARIRGHDGVPLAAIARRFSAVDARYLAEPFPDDVATSYALADQLFVDPHPLPDEGRRTTSSLRIEMSTQEVAVALSHIRVWELIAAGEKPLCLVLEDDVYFRRSFARVLDRAWAQVGPHSPPLFDLLYLSYEEARGGAEVGAVSDAVFRPLRGLWCLSGYVLSKPGAQKLLGRLPVRGPVDLWINHQFGALNVLALRRSVVQQRRDVISGNWYSILPALSKVGILTREKSLTFERKLQPGPVFAFGEPDTGLSSLAAALSMLGYRCCSDLAHLPASEHEALFENTRTRVFDAYVNVGSLDPEDLIRLAKRHPNVRLITTIRKLRKSDAETSPLHRADSSSVAIPGGTSAAVQSLRTTERWMKQQHLVLQYDDGDKWRALSEFLECEYPSYPYPRLKERGQREIAEGPQSVGKVVDSTVERLKWDSLPWIADVAEWHGVPLKIVVDQPQAAGRRQQLFEDIHGDRWLLRDDTFPSNLALFRPGNFTPKGRGGGRLTLREERTEVREYTSAALSTTAQFLYGRFSVDLRPSNVSGVITGMFLHRNSPRQEIDIEFLGKDTTRLLVNVYFNPGVEGARMEYGFRGTPEFIELGFDAADGFHRYEIDWAPGSIRWLVDGRVIWERLHWAPTPIPHLPMQFHVNLWHSRSKELAGRLAQQRLPAHADLRRIDIDFAQSSSQPPPEGRGMSASSRHWP